MAGDPTVGVPFEDILLEHNETCEWLERLGVPISPGRVSSYSTFLARLVDHYQNERWSEIEEELAGHLNALYESSELGRISAAFSDNSVPGLAERLKHVVHGPDSYLSENPSSSNKARNTAFELLVGARFKGAGYEPDYLTSDVKVRLQEYTLHIECKRPSSKRKITKNVKDALNQLNAEYRGTLKSKQRGIVAIDIGKIVNPEFNLLVTDSKEHLDHMLSGITHDFIKSHLEGKGYEGRTKLVGILVRYSGMAIEKESNLYTYCQHYTLFSTGNPGSTENALARDIAQAMKNV